MYLEIYQLILGLIVCGMAALVFVPKRWFSKRFVGWLAGSIFLLVACWLMVLLVTLVTGGAGQQLRVNHMRTASDGQPTLVFVFGWNGDDETWGQFPNLVLEDPRFAGYGVAKIGYRSRAGLEGWPLKRTADAVAALMATELPSRHLVVVAHSMGSVVVRWILSNPDLHATRNIGRFIAVAAPFAGADIASLMTELGLTPATLADLSPGSLFLRDLSRSWANARLGSWTGTDVCVSSQLDTIVSVASATFGCSSAIELLNAGHVDSVKPTSRNDDRYITITQALLGLKQKPPH